MWWVPVGAVISDEEALARLDDLNASARAFGRESPPSVRLRPDQPSSVPS